MRIVKNEILLLKSSIDDIEHNDDPYHVILRESNFLVKSVPVLDFSYIGLHLLQGKFMNPEKYSGVIFTSPRAVKAAKLSLESVDIPKEWKNLPTFVVGEGTAKTLQQELGLDGKGSSGNASELADFILQCSCSFKKPLLFPCGKLKRDILPTKLHEGGLTLDIVVVYETCPHPNIKENLDQVTHYGESIPEFVIYFSPSGVNFTLPVLKQLTTPLQEIKIIAIGPTTKACLEESNLNVWSCALKPSPACLLEAILTRD